MKIYKKILDLCKNTISLLKYDTNGVVEQGVTENRSSGYIFYSIFYSVNEDGSITNVKADCLCCCYPKWKVIIDILDN